MGDRLSGRYFTMARRFIFLAALAFSPSPYAEKHAETFDDYLLRIKSEAMQAGISEKTIDSAFAGLTADERVIGFDRKQPEFTQTFDEYLQARVSPFRQKEGRRLMAQHAELLSRVSDHYGVDANYIVAFWGLETSFGRYQGKYNIIRSLATLGHDQRRSAFFTSELLKALQILDEGHIEPDKFVGAWAGAMGQSQFMPSSFLSFAQDFDGDGRKNIWHSEADVFASIANYLKLAGWARGAPWGVAVDDVTFDVAALKGETYDTRCRALKHHTRKLSIEEWRQQGVNTGPLPEGNYAMIVPDAGDTSTYLVGGNFRQILNYNCANKYAVSVGLLADILSQESS